MPSLFSRSRTTSTPNKNLSGPSNFNNLVSDEFGRVASNPLLSSSALTTKKDKKRAKEHEKRLRQLNTSRDDSLRPETPIPSIPDGSFLPTHLERLRDELGAFRPPKDHDYGYLSHERHAVLDVDQVARLVDVVVEELSTRGGITTPFIFSNTALDLSSSAIKRLITTFLDTCSSGNARAAEQRWREEARFAGPHDLAMCLRWGLARVLRMDNGQEVRGLIPWDVYIAFRDSEATLGYPSSHFDTLFPTFCPPVRSIIVTVLNFLTRVTANSTTSGHTPPTLSPLFGPLFFGIGPSTLPFHHAYLHYLRATNAMEHLILSFIRWQDTPRLTSSNSKESLAASGSANALGVPTRLKEWIKGYPAMLPFLNERNWSERPQARRGARTVRVLSVRRNVRAYTSDLVKSAASWGSRPKSLNPIAFPENGLMKSPVWERIAPTSLKLLPKYSENYRKKMDMPPNFSPDTGYAIPPSSIAGGSGTTSASSTLSGSTLGALSLDTDGFGNGVGMGGREGEEKFRSLTDLKWGEFESMGFSTGEAEQKLKFDLTEGARTARAAKRETLNWSEFSSAGFSRLDGPLNTTLQFNTTLVNTASSWQTHNAEITKKLKKQQKALPAFGWDTEPVIGSEEVIEEAFLDVFCDLICGSGWLDIDREDVLDRDCNWVLIEFRSLPDDHTISPGNTSDPRSSSTLVLFEEFVPLEYRQQLAGGGTKKSTGLSSLFSASNKNKAWKQAATLNGRPYVVGHVPKSPSYRELEFEGLLRGGGATKIISLGGKTGPISPSTPTPTRSATAPPATNVTTLAKQLGALSIPSLDGSRSLSTSPAVGNDNAYNGRNVSLSPSGMAPSPLSIKNKNSRFRLPGGIPVPSPGSKSKSGQNIAPAEYSTVDFETRLASYSDDDYNGGVKDVKSKRRQSKDDAWVDILVGSQSRRLGGQDAQWDGKRSSSLERNRRPLGVDMGSGLNRISDPDAASQEVAQVLASVIRERRPSTPDSYAREASRATRQMLQKERYESLGVAEEYSDEVDEVDTVPRISTTGGGSSIAEGDFEPVSPDTMLRTVSSTTTRSQTQSQLMYDTLESYYDQEEDDDEALQKIAAARLKVQQSRKMSYFDLHPERRVSGTSPIGAVNPNLPLPRDSIDYDPRAVLANDKSDDEDADERDNYGARHRNAQPPLAPPVAPTPMVPAPSTLLRVPERQRSVSPNPPQNKVQPEPAPQPNPAPIASAPIPAPARSLASIKQQLNGASGNATPHVMGPRPPANGSGKASALIEMYRERERERTTSSPANANVNANANSVSPSPAAPVPAAAPASRLPLRAPMAGTAVGLGVSLKDGISGLPSSPAHPPRLPPKVPGLTIPPITPAPTGPPPPIPAAAVPAVLASAPVLAPLDLTDLEPPPMVGLDPFESGRASPGAALRYVHGAPLHNVLEEEEEE